MCSTFEIVFVSLLFTLLLIFIKIRFSTKAKRVFVVVMGDIGRSPRMQFHSLSLAKSGFEVHLFGYKGSLPYSEVLSNPHIHLTYLRNTPSFFSKLSKLLVFVLKVYWQSAVLLLAFLWSSRPSHILLQNPPSLPSVAVCWLMSILCGSQFIIDWHNYGYSILALSLRAKHPLVIIHKWYERFFGRLSSKNICVTNAMREDLLNSWKIKAVTMHDRPPAIFGDLDVVERHSLFQKLDMFRVESSSCDDCTEVNVMTMREFSGQVRYRDDRPALIVSSTSWTEDEDFSVLLSALDVYDVQATTDRELPPLICAITGKGPLKEYYINLIDKKNWTRVRVYTPWLEASDYPRLLASADLGVCLHTSSSGLDLPMKVVDMFGCRLPVCAIHFKCLHELVEHDKNGLVFNNDKELAEQLQELLHGFPNGCHRLQRFREHLKVFQQLRWDDAWDSNVQPLFT